MARQTPTLDVELSLWQTGVNHVAGIDEAGRGCWAGPVFAAAVILPPTPHPDEAALLSQFLAGVRDSKQMSARQRETWANQIKAFAIGWGIGQATNREIDEQGIVWATRLAMQRALEQLPVSAQHLLIDALRLPGCALPQAVLIKGDACCLSIAAASILAKTSRDSWMVQQADRDYPGYGFARHKGYGTALHQAQLCALGPCPLHRLSFAPLRRIPNLE